MTAKRIHPTAIVSPDAEIGSNVEIGAFAIVGEGCSIGDDCVISPRATLERNVSLSPHCRVGIGSVLGGPPQDLKYAGEETTVVIGGDCDPRVRYDQPRHRPFIHNECWPELFVDVVRAHRARLPDRK